jgi:chromosome partitioning protein
VAVATTAVNLAIGLARRNKRVLLIDLDPQANATYALLGTQEPGPTVYHALIGKQSIMDVLRPSNQDGLDVLPADIDLARAEVDLLTAIGGQTRLRAKLAQTNLAYDYAIIDTPLASAVDKPPMGAILAN